MLSNPYSQLSLSLSLSLGNSITMQYRADSAESSTEWPYPSLKYNDELTILGHPNSHWTYVCTYCSKSFPTSQSLGGHQNAHRKERNEERRLCLKNCIANRKGALVQSLGGSPNVCLPVATLVTTPHPPYASLRDHGYKWVERTSRVKYGFVPYGAAHGKGNAPRFPSYVKVLNQKQELALDLDLTLAPMWESDADVGGGTGFVVCDEATVPAVEGGTLTGAEKGHDLQLLDLTLKL